MPIMKRSKNTLAVYPGWLSLVSPLVHTWLLLTKMAALIDMQKYSPNDSVAKLSTLLPHS